MNVSSITSRPLRDVLDECAQIARTRGIAVLIPGDLHLWGKAGGNRSDVFAEILTQVPFEYLLTNGDLFEGRSAKRETVHDAEVLAHIRALDEGGRWIPVRGNHDRRLFVDPHGRVTKRTVPTTQQDRGWLKQPRMTPHTYISIVEGEEYFGPAHPRGEEHREKHPLHPGSHDLLVLTIAGNNFLFEHGDAYDRFIGKLAAKDDLITKVASGIYNMLVTVENSHTRVGQMSDAFKRQFSMLRGVCKSVAVGVTKKASTLEVSIAGTISGHTHYPLHTVIDDIPHVNVGSFRGHRPSFAIITADGELLPPFVIKAEKIKR